MLPEQCRKQCVAVASTAQRGRAEQNRVLILALRSFPHIGVPAPGLQGLCYKKIIIKEQQHYQVLW